MSITVGGKVRKYIITTDNWLHINLTLTKFQKSLNTLPVTTQRIDHELKNYRKLNWKVNLGWLASQVTKPKVTKPKDFLIPLREHCTFQEFRVVLVRLPNHETVTIKFLQQEFFLL